MAKNRVSDLLVDQSFDSILKDLLKNTFRKEAVVTGRDVIGHKSFLSTGSFSLDLELGTPFPVGIHELHGGYGSGKSTMAMHAVVAAQKNGWPVFYIDIERGLNENFLQRFKELNLDKFLQLKPQSGEDACDMAINIFKKVENALVVFDSIAAASATEADIAKTMSEKTMGSLASLMARFLAKALPVIDDSAGRLILINQKRDKLNPYVSGNPTPGGNSVRHYSSSRLFFKRENVQGNLIRLDEERVGKWVDIEINKNRWRAPGKVVAVPIYDDRGIFQTMEILNMACNLAIIEKKKGGRYYFDGKQIAHGEFAAIEYLEENEDFKNNIRLMVLELVSD